MSLNNIVYGVLHLRENAKQVIETVSKDIQKEDRVGIEVTSRTLEVYKKILKDGLSMSDAEKKATKILFEDDYHSKYSQTEEAIEYSRAGHGFFLRVYQALSPLCADVCGLDSQRSNLLRTTSRMYDVDSFFLLLKAYGCNESELEAAHKCNWPILIEILSETHINNYFMKKIKEENCNKAILGLAHAIDIEASTDFKIVRISNESFKRHEEAIAKNQTVLRKKYPEYNFLPDLTDKFEDAEKVKDIPFGENEKDFTLPNEKELEILDGYMKLLKEQGWEGKDVLAYEEKYKDAKISGQPAIRTFQATRVMMRAMDLFKEDKSKKDKK